MATLGVHRHRAPTRNRLHIDEMTLA
jgi:hypothetical protein